MAGHEKFNPQLEVNSFESLQVRMGEQNPEWSKGEVLKQALVVFNTKMFPQQVSSYLAETRGENNIQVDQGWENVGGRLVDKHYGLFEKMIDNATSEEERESLIAFEKEALGAQVGEKIYILDMSALDRGEGVRYVDVYEKDLDGLIKHSERMDLTEEGQDLTIDEAEIKVRGMKVEEQINWEGEWEQEIEIGEIRLMNEGVQNSLVMPWVETPQERLVMFDNVRVEEERVVKEVLETEGVQEVLSAVMEKDEERNTEIFVKAMERQMVLKEREEKKPNKGLKLKEGLEPSYIVIKKRIKKKQKKVEAVKKVTKKKVEKVEKIEKMERVEVKEEIRQVKEEAGLVKLKEERELGKIKIQEDLPEEKMEVGEEIMGEVSDIKEVVRALRQVGQAKKVVVVENATVGAEEVPIWKPEIMAISEEDVPEWQWQSAGIEELNGSLVVAGLKLKIEMIGRAERWFGREKWQDFDDLNQKVEIVVAILFAIVNTSVDQRLRLKMGRGETSLMGLESGGR